MYTVERRGARPVRVWTHDVAHDAMEQLVATAKLACVRPNVAAMPDVHVGIGATVGSVIPTRAAVIPAAVGVDIGCGMLAVELNRSVDELPDSLQTSRLAIEERLPVGKSVHQNVVATDRAKRLEPGLARILERTPAIGTARFGTKMGRVFRSLGTMGGGNHFLELQRSASGAVWLMLLGVPGDRLADRPSLHRRGQGAHRARGYRSPGARSRLARRGIARVRALPRGRPLGAGLRPRGPSHHPGRGPGAMRAAVSCHHNYVEREQHRGEALYDPLTADTPNYLFDHSRVRELIRYA